jgi:hypothetical protein
MYIKEKIERKMPAINSNNSNRSMTRGRTPPALSGSASASSADVGAGSTDDAGAGSSADAGSGTANVSISGSSAADGWTSKGETGSVRDGTVSGHDSTK